MRYTHTETQTTWQLQFDLEDSPVTPVPHTTMSSIPSSAAVTLVRVGSEPRVVDRVRLSGIRVKKDRTLGSQTVISEYRTLGGNRLWPDPPPLVQELANAALEIITRQNGMDISGGARLHPAPSDTDTADGSRFSFCEGVAHLANITRQNGGEQ